MRRDNSARDEPYRGLPIVVGETRLSRMKRALEESGCNLPRGLNYETTASWVLSIYDPVKAGIEVWYIDGSEKVTLESFPTEILSKRLGIKLFEAKGDAVVETKGYLKIKEALES